MVNLIDRIITYNEHPLAILNDMLDPTANGFDAWKLSQYNKPTRSELWFSAPALLVKPEPLNEWIKWKQNSLEIE